MLRKYLLVCLTLSGAMISSCGAKLPREVSIRHPVATATAEKMDLDGVVLKNLQDASTVSVGQYMRDNRLNWLVLTFGSQGCGVCMEKARYLQANLVGHYNILGEGAENKIRLIGVTTDPEKDREQLLTLVQDQGLTHLQWSDPGHIVMMNRFQPEGMGFSVPLTVMLSRDGVLWRVSSREKLSPTQLIQKISSTMGGTTSQPPPIDPEVPFPPPIDAPLLAREIPERLNAVNLKSCRDRSIANLGEILPIVKDGLRAVLLRRENCEDSDACRDALVGMNAWKLACQSKGGRSCEFQELVLSGDYCSESSGFFGGEEFFEVFADHFSWGYAPIDVGPGRTKLPEIKGPLSLVFDDLGRLVFSKEGALGDSMIQRLEQDGMRSRAIGPNYPIVANMAPVSKNPRDNVTSFSALRTQAKYTMVMFWNTWCSSCTDEIQEWHREQDSAFNFCKAHDQFCQVVALETKRSESELSPEAYLQGLIDGNDDFDGWRRLGWTMPVAAEGLPSADGTAARGWFDGWVRARFGSSEPMTVLFDREGKIVEKWRSLPGEHGPRDALNYLLKLEEKP